MKLPKQRYLFALMCAMGLGSWATPTLADVQYKFSGFGTLGATKTNTDETEFRTSVEQFRGAGKTVDLGGDSKLAVQSSAVFSNGVTLTAQVLGSRKMNDDFDMGFEWLFAQYTGIDGLDLKGGRVVLPAFLASDSRLVGYSTPWLRVSPLVYAMMPLSHVDGAQATYRRSFGPAVASVQITGGGASGPSSNTSVMDLSLYSMGVHYVPTTVESDTSRILGLNAALEWGDWTLRFSQIRDRTSLDLTIYNPAAIGGGTTPRSIEFDDKFQEIGLQYDDGTAVLMAEHVKRSTKNIQTQASKAWYVGAGYRFGNVMPYVMVSQYKESFSMTGNVPPKATGLALGARYDFASNLALKAEWARYKNNSTYISTDNVSPGVADKKLNVMSVALDFIF